MISLILAIPSIAVYTVVGLFSRLLSQERARKLKASWALTLASICSGGADDYYLEELERFFSEEPSLLGHLERSMPGRPSGLLAYRQKLLLEGFKYQAPTGANQ